MARCRRELKASDLINRIVHAEVPPRVEYQLTKEGESLKPIRFALKKCAEDQAVKLLKEREPGSRLHLVPRLASPLAKAQPLACSDFSSSLCYPSP
ncbi:MAG: winged helix-turn-helix transcriptional regulator [Haloferula sp.]